MEITNCSFNGKHVKLSYVVTDEATRRRTKEEKESWLGDLLKPILNLPATNYSLELVELAHAPQYRQTAVRQPGERAYNRERGCERTVGLYVRSRGIAVYLRKISNAFDSISLAYRLILKTLLHATGCVGR